MALTLPTEAEIKTQTANGVKIANETRKFLNVNATNYAGLKDTFLQALEGPNTDRTANALAQLELRLDAALKGGRELILPLLETYCQVIGRPVPQGNADAVFDALYDHMVANTLRVTSRQFSYGVPAAGGSNTGSGVLNRLTKDENNFDLEAQTADAKTVVCRSDYRNGVEQGREVFEIRGGASLFGDSWIQIEGSGRIGTLTGLTGTDSGQFIGNPSFSTLASGSVGSPTLSAWTQSGTFQLDGTNYYRKLNGETTPYALQYGANGYVQQSLDDRRIRVNPRVPMYCQAAWNREVGAGDGTLTLTLGNKTASVVLAAQTGWQILRIALDDDCWYKNWKKNDALLKIDLASRTTGTVLVDDVIVAPMQLFNGGWYAVVGGATPFLRDDVFTFTDTEVGSILQYFFWLYFGRHLPHTTGGGVTWAEP